MPVCGVSVGWGATVLETDFANSRLTGADELRARPWWFKVAVQVSRLMAPVQ